MAGGDLGDGVPHDQHVLDVAELGEVVTEPLLVSLGKGKV